MKKDALAINKEIERLKSLLKKLLESPVQDKNKILEISHKLDQYILKYYETTNNDTEEE